MTPRLQRTQGRGQQQARPPWVHMCCPILFTPIIAPTLNTGSTASAPLSHSLQLKWQVLNPGVGMGLWQYLHARVHYKVCPACMAPAWSTAKWFVGLVTLEGPQQVGRI
jgi:hypothetical protein